jgi:hypothetical protein
VPYSISSPLLYRQGFEYRRIDPAAVLALPSSSFRLRFRRKKQGGIAAHLSDDSDLLFEQWKNQRAAHEPGIDQQAHPLDLPPDRVHQLPCHPELAPLARLFEQPRANGHRQRRAQPDANNESQRDPALAVQKGGSIGLVAVIVLDTDSRPELHAARNQRIVEDQGHQFGRAHPQVQAKSRTDLAAAQAMQSAKRELFAGFVKPKRRA